MYRMTDMLLFSVRPIILILSSTRRPTQNPIFSNVLLHFVEMDNEARQLLGEFISASVAGDGEGDGDDGGDDGDGPHQRDTPRLFSFSRQVAKRRASLEISSVLHPLAFSASVKDKVLVEAKAMDRL